MAKPWTKRSSRVVGEYSVFRLRCDRMASPRNGFELDAFILETRPWVTVLPTTLDNEVVMVRQYRFGIEAVTLETPGGLMDPTDESPEAAARRELLEETGCEAEEMVPLGVVRPNPAIQNTACHIFWAKNVFGECAQALDEGEDIQIERLPLDEVPRMIHQGTIQHSIVLNAFYLFDLYQKSNTNAGD